MLAKTAEEEMGENVENYLDALNAFERKPSREIPSELEQLLCRIARNGEPLFPWSKLKPLVTTKLENVIQEYIQSNPCEEVPMLPNVENIKFDDMRERLLRALNAFNSAPFTMQRLCELLTQPKRYYQRSDKFMRGIEKNVQVVSTVTPTGKRITHSCEVRNRSLMMNGFPSDIHTEISTPLSNSQTSGQPVSPGENTHTNGETVTGSQQHENNTAVTTSSGQEELIDSTRQSVSPTEPEPELVLDTDQRTSTDSTSAGADSISAGADSVKECSESTSNEAEACKPMDVGEATRAADLDDSDGNKGDADQDSCSSLDSADSGDSSPDSALPPSSGYFDNLPPKDNNGSPEPTQTHKGAETVESTNNFEELAAEDEAATPEQKSVPPADQSHSSMSTPTQEQQVSLLVTSTVTGTTDTNTGQSEATTETAKAAEASEREPGSAKEVEIPTEKASQSESSSEEIGELTEEPMDQD